MKILIKENRKSTGLERNVDSDSKRIKKPIKMGRRIISIIFILILILLSIYYFTNLKNNDNKNENNGNNRSIKNIKDMEEYILAIESYTAKVEITVHSNKNTNKYILQQEVKKNTITKQIVIEPSSIAGLEISLENNQLKIKNTNLNLEKIYKDYTGLSGNNLFLTTFIEEYKQAVKKHIYEKDGQIYMEIEERKENNKYNQNQRLCIDSKTNAPKELVISDMNKKDKVYILYNEIKIDSLNK